MIERWKILIETINMSDGYSASVEYNWTDKNAAKQKFFDKLSQFGGNPQVKFLRVSLISPMGIVDKMEEIDNSNKA